MVVIRRKSNWRGGSKPDSLSKTINMTRHNLTLPPPSLLFSSKKRKEEEEVWTYRRNWFFANFFTFSTHNSFCCRTFKAAQCSALCLLLWQWTARELWIKFTYSIIIESAYVCWLGSSSRSLVAQSGRGVLWPESSCWWCWWRLWGGIRGRKSRRTPKSYTTFTLLSFITFRSLYFVLVHINWSSLLLSSGVWL